MAEVPSEPAPASTSGRASPGRTPCTRRAHRPCPRPQPGRKARQTAWILDEADRICGVCGAALKPFPRADEVAVAIDVEARHVVKRLPHRQAYPCRHGARLEATPGPDKRTASGRDSLDFAAAVTAAS